MEGEPKEDVWALPELRDDSTPWKDLSGRSKALKVLSGLGRALALGGLLYAFVCSISLLASAFRLLGGAQAGRIFQNNQVVTNPMAGLVMGVLGTVLVQSSSTSTSVVVTMVSAGLLQVPHAVYIIMGANIGTSVTNTLVSVFHAGERSEFRRAFAAATVHDAFNWLAVLVLLPLELLTASLGLPGGGGLLVFLSHAATQSARVGDATKVDFLKTLTKPLTSRIVQLDKKAINLMVSHPEAVANDTNFTISKHPGKPAYLLESLKSDVAMGAILLAASLVVLCVCLVLIVKLLRSALQGSLARLVRNWMNADLPGCLGRHLTGYLAIALGAVLTFLVQSSSIFTSTLTPLVAVGALSLERSFPLTLGSNIGTTGTALIAAFASDRVQALQIALCHLFFNVLGILVWYPVPFLRAVPVRLAKALGHTTAKYRWFAVLYLLCMFLLFPVLVLGLSLLHVAALASVGGAVLVLLLSVALLNVLQGKAPHLLPAKLRSWAFLPEALRSLEPCDRALVRALLCCPCRRPAVAPEEPPLELKRAAIA